MIETAGEQIHDVTISRNSFGKRLIELRDGLRFVMRQDGDTDYL